MAGINSHILDFDVIETENSKSIAWIDASTYMEPAERPLLEVVMPGANKYHLVNIAAGEVNTFNSSTLGIHLTLNASELVDLSDGLWKFTYKICPYDLLYVRKNHMRTVKLRKKLSDFHDKYDFAKMTDAEISAITIPLAKIYSLIEGAKLLANVNPTKATSYYRLANDLTQELIDKQCKNFN